MTLWDKVSKGIDRAARATESALDEGKLRVAAYKARQRADKRAETLGYAVARARAEGREPDADAIGRLVDAVHAADAEATALEAKARTTGDGVDGSDGGPGGETGATPTEAEPQSADTNQT